MVWEGVLFLMSEVPLYSRVTPAIFRLAEENPPLYKALQGQIEHLPGGSPSALASLPGRRGLRATPAVDHRPCELGGHVISLLPVHTPELPVHTRHLDVHTQSFLRTPTGAKQDCERLPRWTTGPAGRFKSVPMPRTL